PAPRHQRHELQLAPRLRRPSAPDRDCRRLQARRAQPDLRLLPGRRTTVESVWSRQRHFPRPRPGLRLPQHPLTLAGVLEAFPVLRVGSIHGMPGGELTSLRGLIFRKTGGWLYAGDKSPAYRFWPAELSTCQDTWTRIILRSGAHRARVC